MSANFKINETNELSEAEGIACEIASVHLDVLFRAVHEFQLGHVSRAALIESLLSHSSAMDEVALILNQETLRAEKNQKSLSKDEAQIEFDLGFDREFDVDVDELTASTARKAG